MRLTFSKTSGPKSPLSPVSPTTNSNPTHPNSRKGSASSYFSGPTSPRLDTISEQIATKSAPGSRTGSMAGIHFGPTETRKSVEAAAAAKNGENVKNGKGTKIVIGGGAQKPLPKKGRERSPPAAAKFTPHVSFDNVASDLEPTDRNPISYTLKEEHIGYHYKRQSRTFMCGINEDAYSDYALQWMLDEMVDDGDEVICLRVVEKDSKMSNDKGVREKYYQKEAKRIMKEVQRRNEDGDGAKAISITVEFAIGKVHSTFTKMIQMHEPAMLIVGTRGRSLGGVQGLIGNRNSFSKWCLQYSPIPVVVVRPDDKREKKKSKRMADPSRRGYAAMLGGVHEADIDMSKEEQGREITEILPPNSREVEMHEVAKALALPAKFDPMIRQEDLNQRLQTIKSRHRSEGDLGSALSSLNSSPAGSRNASPHSKLRVIETRGTDSPALSDADNDNDSDDDDEGDFEVTTMGGGKKAVHDKEVEVQKQQKLHNMEKGEAGALLRGRKGSVESVASFESNISKKDGK